MLHLRETEIVELDGRKYLLHHIVDPATRPGGSVNDRQRTARRGGVRAHAQAAVPDVSGPALSQSGLRGKTSIRRRAQRRHCAMAGRQHPAEIHRALRRSAVSRTLRKSNFPVPRHGKASTWKNWSGRGFQRFGRSTGRACPGTTARRLRQRVQDDQPLAFFVIRHGGHDKRLSGGAGQFMQISPRRGCAAPSRRRSC